MENGIIKREEHGIQTIEKMGQYMARSGLFGVKTADQAIALMLIAQAEGYHPAYAARDYDIINGRPALKAKAKLARFQKSGGVVKWQERSDTKASAIFSHPSAPNEITITWTMKEANQAGLDGKDNWKKYPRQMLSARVISEGVDATYPDAGGLMYVPEEIIDFDNGFNNNPSPDKKIHEDVIDIQPEKEKSKTDAAGIKEIDSVLENKFGSIGKSDNNIFREWVKETYGFESIQDCPVKIRREIYKEITKDEEDSFSMFWKCAVNK